MYALCFDKRHHWKGPQKKKFGERNSSYEKKKIFFSWLANKRCWLNVSMRENLIEVEKVQAMAVDTAIV